MANTLSNDEVRGAPPRLPEHGSAEPLPRRVPTTDDSSAHPETHVGRIVGLPEVEPPSIEVLERVLVALKALPSVAE